jgi:amicoumacin kinase
MEQAVEKVFTSDVIRTGSERFGVAVDEKRLGDFENYLYRAMTKDGDVHVLRFTHSSHRTYGQVQAELEFLNYVADGGANVAKPYHSLGNKLVETCHAEDGTYFYCSLFEFAKGQPVKTDDASIWNDTLFYEWGKTIGKLHRLVMEYPHTEHRGTWEEDEMAAIQCIKDKEVRAIGLELIEEMKKLPATKRTFGLIHSDIHYHNFFYEEGHITVFDFDDAMYNYFIHDIAIVLYYSLVYWDGTEEEKVSFTRHQLEVVRKGYETEHSLEEHWYETLPLFMQLRDVTLYAVLLKKFDGELPERQKNLVDTLYKRIITKKAIVEL